MISDLFLTNIKFPDSYTASIEGAQAAQQKLQQTTIEAQSVVAAAVGAAKAEVTQAQADATANALRRQSLTPELIQWLMVNKWNGQLPQVTGNTSTSFGGLGGK